MSSTIRDGSLNELVRRMVSLPRSILGGVTRAIGRGRGRLAGGRRDQSNVLSNLQPQHSQQPFDVPEEWTFLTTYEQQYGSTHPFFYACRFVEALKIAEEEHKFMFMYIHSPEHPFTPPFCRETLCSELVVQFLDANFVSWGALADRGEGLHMATTLQPAAFPCYAVVAAAGGDGISVLQQMEGPISTGKLIEILQRTVEEQGLAFGNGRPMPGQARTRTRNRDQEAQIKADRQLREEQDAAFLAALKIDKERDQNAQSSTKTTHQKISRNTNQKQHGNGKEPSTTKETQQATEILIRFPNGERRHQKFSCSDNIRAIFRYIDSLGLQVIGSYRLVTSFPRRVYGADQMEITLKDAGLHPKATVFVELI